MNLEDLPPDIKFAYISFIKTAIYFKEMGLDKNSFLSFCNEIWDSMELSDFEYLKNVFKDIPLYTLLLDIVMKDKLNDIK